MNWKPFSFEGNHAWGRVETLNDWFDIVKTYIAEEGDGIDMLAAKQHCNGGDSFGFYAEYNGEKTLKDFFRENEMLPNGI